MPITAKLSRRFYEQLGDDVTNELVDWLNSVDATYQLSLREHNEANFARFDARLEQRVAALRADVGELRSEMNARFETADARIERRFAEEREAAADRLNQAEARLGGRISDLERQLTGKISGVEQQLTGKISGVEQQLTGRISDVEQQLTGKISDLDRRMSDMGMQFGVAIAGVEKQLPKLEAKLLRWMFAFWVTSILAYIGVAFGLVHSR